MRRFADYTLAFLCLAVAAYAVAAYAFFPMGKLVHPEMGATFRANAAAMYVHIFGAVFALALGPFQFSARLRTRYRAVHRWMGRLYLGVGVLAGGLAGLYVAQFAYGGTPSRLGFTLLALAWLYTGWRAFAAIRAGDVATHRAWMLRNFALTLAAVTLRLYLPFAFLSGLPPAAAYSAIAWLCWVPNLLAVLAWQRREALFGRGAPHRRKMEA